MTSKNKRKQLKINSMDNLENSKKMATSKSEIETLRLENVELKKQIEELKNLHKRPQKEAQARHHPIPRVPSY